MLTPPSGAPRGRARARSSRSVWSLISPLIAKLDDGRPLRRDDAALDLLVLDALLVPLGGLIGILGGEVLGAVAQPRFEPVEERLVGRPLVARAFHLVQAGLVRSRSRDASPRPRRALRRPKRPSAGPIGKRQALPDERDEDHHEREERR